MYILVFILLDLDGELENGVYDDKEEQSLLNALISYFWLLQ